MNKKHYSYEFIIYEEDIINEVIKICIKNSYNYCYILHDKDDNKKHFHFLIFFNNQRYISSVSTEFNIQTNLINYVKDKKYAIQYLVHYNDSSKFQYSITDIRSSFDFYKYFSKSSDETTSIISLLEFIDSQKYIYNRDLFSFVIEHDFWSVYRRNYTIIKDLVYEHNLLFTKK